jgi:hypothetical protein
MSTNTGTIYYTTDGSDPRTSITGAVATSAKTYSAAINIGSTITIKARAKTSTEWSALSQVDFVSGSPNAVQLPLNDLLACSNYPNPFTQNTYIKMCIPYQNELKISVYNTNGQLIDVVHEGLIEVGERIFEWQPATNQRGIYMCKIQFGKQTSYLKLIRN